MQTVLVTGGAGFIGSHVCERLVFLGKNVICFDDLNKYNTASVKERNITGLKNNPRFTFVRADITHADSLAKIFTAHRIDAVIHLAARAGVRPSLDDPILYAQVNIHGTINLLEQARAHGVKKIVVASSSSVYGTNTKTPFCESDPTDALVSPYAASKKAMEIYCRMYHEQYGIPTVCLRFFTVYGPRGRLDMAVHKFIKAIDAGEQIQRFGDGTTKRDYTFIDDIVDGIISALHADTGFEIINLGNNTPVMLNNLIKTIETALGKKASIIEKPEQQGDVPITYANLTKAKRLLQYEPKTSLADGIQKTVKWYEEQQ